MVRLGIVKYLNTKPLVYSIERGEFSSLFFPYYDVPSACARKLKEKKVDLGVIPSIEYARDEDYRIVPHISIASFGKVESIILFVPMTKSLSSIRRIALDNSSRTSVNLLKILCQKKFGIDPEFRFFLPEIPQIFEVGDAVLLIGDPALYYSDKKYQRIDLGEVWSELTGLPFVYSFWVGRKGEITREHIFALLASKREGMKNLPEIARNYSQGREERYELNLRYLSRNIHYDLAEAELKGLKKYFEWAGELNLIEKVPNIKFYDE
jgi:chorismate dehydratase